MYRRKKFINQEIQKKESGKKETNKERNNQRKKERNTEIKKEINKERKILSKLKKYKKQTKWISKQE